MEYYEQLTFTGKGDVEEAEETAIKLIRDFEELALQRCPDKGYIVGYSGGKDSDKVKELDACYTNNYFIVNPMAYWTTDVRDRYIAKHSLEINPVYKKYGLKRCGCLMCCMASPKDRQKEAKLFPKYAENLRRLCEKIAKNRTQDISGGGTLRDISAVEMYEFYFRVR